MEESKLRIEVDINAYIRLYEKGLRLDQIKPLNNPTYKLFSNVSYPDIRIVSNKRILEDPVPYVKIQYFAKDNNYFYMIPITTIKGTITGFILRGVTKHSYSTVSRDFNELSKRVPLMFGFDKSFSTYDEQCEKKGKSLPIIVCEGSKDCMVLKKMYPYVVSLNTSSMGVNATVLRNISNRFLLAYDNDTSGQEGMTRDKEVLRNNGCYVDSLKLDYGFKDCADYFECPAAFKKLADRVKKQLKILFNS